MATNVATKANYHNIGPVATTLTERDQVDNSTNATLTFKPNPRIYTMNDKYHREDERLKTFDTWPLEWLDKHELALTGMFFTNENDKVKCYFCEVEIGRWEREDQPVSEHLRWSPNCPLLRRRTTNNVPLNSDALERALPAISYDICGSNDSGVELRENAYPEGSIPMSHIIQSVGVNTVTPAELETNGDVQPEPCRPAANYYPEYPEYALESVRVRSFEEWPRHMKQKKEQLAEAGFFYTGVGDRVRCFSCGGGLKDWDEKDEPWEQHALWLSQCRFLKLMKGNVYIDTVVAKSKPLAASESNSSSISETISLPVEESSESQLGDVAPLAASSAATRIYDKIVAIAKEDNSQISTSSTASGGAGPSPNGSATILEEKLCKICYAAEYNTAFLPCGHVVACAKCASSVTKCPLCRKPFTDVMRVYFS